MTVKTSKSVKSPKKEEEEKRKKGSLDNQSYSYHPPSPSDLPTSIISSRLVPPISNIQSTIESAQISSHLQSPPTLTRSLKSQLTQIIRSSPVSVSVSDHSPPLLNHSPPQLSGLKKPKLSTLLVSHINTSTKQRKKEFIIDNNNFF